MAITPYFPPLILSNSRPIINTLLYVKFELGVVSGSNVYKLKKEIQQELEANGYILPKGLIPMCEAVKKLKIDVDYLNKMNNL